MKTIIPKNPSTLLCIAALVCIAATCPASTLDPASRQTLALQIALDRAGFSPGLLDGKPGAKTSLALADFQRAHNMPPTGKLDPATNSELLVSDGDPTVNYTITADDLARVTGRIPKNWNEKAKMRLLGYESPLEALSEKFHCTRALLSALNPGVDLTKAESGASINVPATEIGEAVHAARLEIHLSQKTIRAFDAQENLIALFHCSIANDLEKRPKGKTNITGVIENPAYSFDPAMWPEVKNVFQKLLIPAGPRNPVGVCWIGLNLKGYGIHGTPNPELIGKTGSHGCFRLANWDAQRLGKMVREGTAVKFITNDNTVTKSE